MNNFNQFDLRDELIERITYDSDVHSDELLKLLDVTELSFIEQYAEENGLIDSEEALTERFNDEILPLIYERHGIPGIAFNDERMINEAFNNWTDGLCKGGELHDLQYNKYCYLGDE